MKGTKHKPEQIIKKLREADAMLSAEKSIGQVCQALQISEQTYHRSPRRLRRDEGWRGQATEGTGRREQAAQEGGGGIDVGQGSAAGGPQGKLLSPARRRSAVRHVQERRSVSQRRACQALGVSRSTQRYQVQGDTGEVSRLVARMHELVRTYPRYGYRMIGAKLRQEGWHMNIKKVYRLWRREGFKVPRKTRKKRRLGHSGNSCIRRRAEGPDHVWTWDFIHDRTTHGQPLKWFAITDEYTRECLALEVDRGLTADGILDILTNLFLTRGVPRHIRSDNGPEFIATAIRRHGQQAGLEMLYIEPGSPWENGFAESFFSRLRDELLNCEEFANLAEARWFARRRQHEHNHERPHSSLDYQTPVQFAAACAASAPATPALQQHTRREEDKETQLPVTQPILS